MIDRRTLIVASLGTLTVLASFTAPLAGFTETVEGLGAGPNAGTWVLSSMSIGLGAFLLTTGRLADDYGRRRWFVVGCVALAAASLAGALAQDPLTFVISRIVTGAGGAAIIAAGLGMLAAAHPALPDRARATGIWGASIGGGIAIGPLLGTYLAALHSWRDIYVVLAVAGLALAGAASACPESRSPEPSRVDVPGVVLLAVGIGALLAGLTAGRQGWGRPITLLTIATGVALLIGFVLVERSSNHPMLDVTLFRRPAFVAVNLAGLATGAGVIALVSYIPGLVGAALAISATTAAWMILAWSLPSVLTAFGARRLPESWNGRSRMAAALMVIAVGQLTLLSVTTTSGPWRFVPGLLLAGVATGVLNASMARESTTSVPEGRAGLGSGANNTARYLGSAVGVTLVSVAAAPPGVTSTAGLIDGWHRAVLITAGASLLGAVCVLVFGERRSPPASAGHLDSVP